MIVMVYSVFKVLLSATIIVAVAEIAKRNTLWAAALASIPLSSLLAFVWLYIDTGNTEKIAVLASEILWLVIPSLLMFISLPVLLRANFGFWLSLALSCILTIAAYALVIWGISIFASKSKVL